MNKTELLKQQTLEILQAQQHRRFKAKELARLLKIPPKEYGAYRNLLKGWAEDGIIARHKSNSYHAGRPPSIAIGELHVKTHGYGFLLTPEGEEDVFISLKNMGTALHGDLVKVQLFARSNKRRPEGKVIEVLQRKRRYIVGTLKQGKHFYFLEPDDLKITRDIYVHESDLNGAKAGQKVAVEIDVWEDELLNPEGHVAQILGFPDEPGVDVLSVVANYNLPMEFPAQAEQEAKKFKDRITKKEMKNRLDLRDLVCFTIDPPDAKDFDDAVSLRRLENGHYELGVHIADVSHYVPEGSALDTEALERGTSVYLVDRVLPMLPERLSNGLCSLRPEVDRLAFSCLMEVTPGGDVRAFRIEPSVIHSHRRFSYEEVQAFFDAELELPQELAAPLRDMRELARTLRYKRIQAGSLEFETPEPKIILDEKGRPVRIERRSSLESMQMIEEFMLLANKTVARSIDALATDVGPPPFIYRIHEKPSAEKIAAFRDFVTAMGYQPDLDGRITSKKLSNFLKTIEDEDERTIIDSVMLRSLMKARYSIENLGHFGLAFKHYTHFTSPIRRYPDLVVHRLLKKYRQEGWNEALRAGLTGKLDAICQKASEREVVALEAERASIKLKQVEYMGAHLGEEFDGIISGVVHFGIFVEITAFLVEGLVHISDLHEDFYTFDEKALTLTGSTTGERFRLGDHVRVRVVRVDRDERIIDLILVKKYDKKAKTVKSEKPDDKQTKGDPVKERTVAKRQLTRADDNRTIITTMRQGGLRNTRTRGNNNQRSKKGSRRHQNNNDGVYRGDGSRTRSTKRRTR